MKLTLRLYKKALTFILAFKQKLSMINNDIQESYCSFEVSKLLKEKGFDVKENDTWALDQQGNRYQWRINGYPVLMSKEDCWNPTHALAIEWIRINYGLWIIILPTAESYFTYKIIKMEGIIETPPYKDVAAYDYRTPQEATEAGLLYTLTNLI
jgi:hypothetical protein